MFPEPTENALDWLFDLINLDPNIRIKHIDTRNQLADMLDQREISHVTNGIIFCVCSTSANFSSINSLKAMSKRTQEDASEGRVTAKSKPMMNLVSRWRVRDPTVPASTASEGVGKTKSESQNVPLSSLNVQQTSTGRPVHDKFVIDDDTDSDTAAESNFSLKSRSFLKRVNDCERCWTVLQKIHCTLTNVLFGECLCLRHWKHLYSWERNTQTKDELSSCRCFNDIIWGSKDNEKECIAYSTLVSLFAKRFPAGRWSFLGLGSEAKWSLIKFGESGHPVFRATSPLSRGALKNKGGGQLSIHFCADGDTSETVFRTIISVNQLSIYRAVSDLCEEYSNCQTRTGRLVVAEQSDPLFVPADLLIMTPTTSFEILAQENLLQKHKERVEKLPQPDQLIKVCTDAGFRKTVEVGQYLMTKHTDEFYQFVVPLTCREYIFTMRQQIN